MSLSLIILAAGKGSRFGGDKQLAEVGPAGQALFEYSVFDAFKAGFTHIVFVISQNQDTGRIDRQLLKYKSRLTVEYVVQGIEISSAPLHPAAQSRSKPWGTAHAVLCCEGVVNNSFAVINADDFYGRSNFSAMARSLVDHRADARLALMPGYQLGNTLSETGGVNRGFCTLSSEGYLQSIREVHDIKSDGDGRIYVDSESTTSPVPCDTVVSMNFWGFHPAVFPVFKQAFDNFLQNCNAGSGAELYIPAVVDHAINVGKLSVKVFPTTEKWKGVTYAADLAGVKDYINLLTAAGVYPEELSGT